MSETRICANCGAEHPVEDMYQVEGDWLCEDCADRLTVICDHCAERFYEKNIVEDDTHTLCDHCFDEYYVRCEDCNSIIHRDRTYWDNDDNAAAHPAGMNTARLFTNIATRQTLFSTARAFATSALSSKSTTVAR